MHLRVLAICTGVMYVTFEAPNLSPMRACMWVTGDVLGQVTPSDQARLGLGSCWADGLVAHWILFRPGRLPSARGVGTLDRPFVRKVRGRLDPPAPPRAAKPAAPPTR